MAIPRRHRRISTFTALEERTLLAASHGWQVHVPGPTPENTVEIIDVDDDGDFDFITMDPIGTVGRRSFFWQENLGDSRLGQRRLIASEYGAFDAIATDLDADGRTDLLLVSYGFEVNEYRVVRNQSDGLHVSEHSFRSGYNTQKLEVADVNNDGMGDLLISSSEADSRLELITIDSQGRGTRKLNTKVFGGFRDAAFLDVDGDADLDIVTTMHEQMMTPQTTVWYENVDGKGTFSAATPKNLIDAPVELISVVDFDQDGTDDMLVNRGELGVFPYNYVAGKWTESARLNVNSFDVRTAFDMDGDGDLDLLGYKVWHENQVGKYVTQPLRLPVDFIDLADMDSDGTLDFYDRASFRWYEFRRAGDSNGDGMFCSSDLVAAMTAGKYLEGAASFNEGDWNGDGVFNSADLIFAFAAKTYQEQCSSN